MTSRRLVSLRDMTDLCAAARTQRPRESHADYFPSRRCEAVRVPVPASIPRPRASARKRKTPTVGFVSLGCPKALVDSERILTQLRAEGYLIAPRYEDADLVVVNTCGFIDEAVDESLDAIGEALDENGKVIVTGCLGAKGDIVRKTHPRVLAVTGPHATAEVMQAVRRHLPQPHDPVHEPRSALIREASSSRRRTTRISRSPKAAITAAPSASFPRCAATSSAGRSAK